ncbi:unnamed protein product [Amoebophrya sp. A120]|nr:unnamed protein product [Amoebophrya sp. A120]|eukprot:GSA120T00018056001.1
MTLRQWELLVSLGGRKARASSLRKMTTVSTLIFSVLSFVAAFPATTALTREDSARHPRLDAGRERDQGGATPPTKDDEDESLTEKEKKLMDLLQDVLEEDKAKEHSLKKPDQAQRMQASTNSIRQRTPARKQNENEMNPPTTVVNPSARTKYKVHENFREQNKRGDDGAQSSLVESERDLRFRSFADHSDKQSSTSEPSSPTNTTRLPELDPREFKHMTLANGLGVLLVRDQDARKASLGMAVQTGSANDPVALPGLAHFLEHMLFLGSEKFEDPEAFGKVISQCDGSDNAYTDQQHTVYFNEFALDCLDTVAEVFAGFFKDATLNSSFVEKEVNAVDQEHAKNKNDMSRRMYELMKHQSADPKSPMSHFFTGDKETLFDLPKQNNIDTTKALREFYNLYYCPSNMALTIVGSAPLEQLAGVAEKYFAFEKSCKAPPDDSVFHKEEMFCLNHLPATELSAFPAMTRTKSDPEDECADAIAPEVQGRHLCDYPEAFPPSRLGSLYVSDTLASPELWFLFPLRIKNLDAKYQYGVEQYLSFLTGDAGPTSLQTVLKQQGLITGMGQWFMPGAAGPAVFFIFSLTEEGDSKVDLVQKAFFAWLHDVREKGVNEDYYRAIQQLSQVNFKWAERGGDPMDTAASLARAQTEYALPDLVAGGSSIDALSPCLVDKLFSFFTPANMNIGHATKRSDLLDGLNEKAPHYGYSYKQVPLTPALLSDLQDVSLAKLSADLQQAADEPAGAPSKVGSAIALIKLPTAFKYVPKVNQVLLPAEERHGIPTREESLDLYHLGPQPKTVTPKIMLGFHLETVRPKEEEGVVSSTEDEDEKMKNTARPSVKTSIFSELHAMLASRVLEPLVDSFVNTGSSYSYVVGSNSEAFSFSGYPDHTEELMATVVPRALNPWYVETQSSEDAGAASSPSNTTGDPTENMKKLFRNLVLQLRDSLQDVSSSLAVAHSSEYFSVLTQQASFSREEKLEFLQKYVEAEDQDGQLLQEPAPTQQESASASEPSPSAATGEMNFLQVQEESTTATQRAIKLPEGTVLLMPEEATQVADDLATLNSALDSLQNVFGDKLNLTSSAIPSSNVEKESKEDPFSGSRLGELYQELHDHVLQGKNTKKLRVTALAVGNMDQEQAKKFTAKFHELLVEQPGVLGQANLIAPKDGSAYTRIWEDRVLNQTERIELRVKNPIETDANDAIRMVWRYPVTPNLKEKVLLNVMLPLISKETFSFLRTKHQLGYVAFGHIAPQLNTVQYVVGVQGTKLGPDAIEPLIVENNQLIRSAIADMKDADVLSRKNAFLSQLAQPATNIGSEYATLWGEISSDKYCFERTQYLLDLMRTYMNETATSGSKLESFVQQPPGIDTTATEEFADEEADEEDEMLSATTEDSSSVVEEQEQDEEQPTIAGSFAQENAKAGAAESGTSTPASSANKAARTTDDLDARTTDDLDARTTDDLDDLVMNTAAEREQDSTQAEAEINTSIEEDVPGRDASPAPRTSELGGEEEALATGTGATPGEDHVDDTSTPADKSEAEGCSGVVSCLSRAFFGPKTVSRPVDSAPAREKSLVQSWVQTSPWVAANDGSTTFIQVAAQEDDGVEMKKNRPQKVTQNSDVVPNQPDSRGLQNLRQNLGLLQKILLRKEREGEAEPKAHHGRGAAQQQQGDRENDPQSADAMLNPEGYKNSQHESRASALLQQHHAHDEKAPGRGSEQQVADAPSSSPSKLAAATAHTVRSRKHHHGHRHASPLVHQNVAGHGARYRAKLLNLLGQLISEDEGQEHVEAKKGLHQGRELDVVTKTVGAARHPVASSVTSEGRRSTSVEKRQDAQLSETFRRKFLQQNQKETRQAASAGKSSHHANQGRKRKTARQSTKDTDEATSTDHETSAAQFSETEEHERETSTTSTTRDDDEPEEENSNASPTDEPQAQGEPPAELSEQAKSVADAIRSEMLEVFDRFFLEPPIAIKLFGKQDQAQLQTQVQQNKNATGSKSKNLVCAIMPPRKTGNSTTTATGSSAFLEEEDASNDGDDGCLLTELPDAEERTEMLQQQHYNYFPTETVCAPYQP